MREMEGGEGVPGVPGVPSSLHRTNKDICGGQVSRPTHVYESRSFSVDIVLTDNDAFTFLLVITGQYEYDVMSYFHCTQHTVSMKKTQLIIVEFC